MRLKAQITVWLIAELLTLTMILLLSSAMRASDQDVSATAFGLYLQSSPDAAQAALAFSARPTPYPEFDPSHLERTIVTEVITSPPSPLLRACSKYESIITYMKCITEYILDSKLLS
ncbi:hypothetical protein BN2476_250037 [Paraburkholderia piptadeniae]|uniref:Uncharacterized protein n=1 Tax=Paraburkholderia piptadeniae TaxID=1701573 RepID=A0A1N7S000_9BURK|nr:hypothetical protein [Paraburkholderia piptadeniae]SIT40712.1 hypothetical protein BN2476_250037 [Paraburkholderia piptadeniae]